MQQSFALALWFVLLVALLRLDPVRLPGRSIALWLPVVWFFLIGSRLPSQWFGGGIFFTGGTLSEGNALDRNIWLALIFLSFLVLASRSFRWQEFFAKNAALTALIALGLLSVLWSDFPFVAFKRWLRDLGAYLVILVTLSDSSGVNAVRWVFRRVFFLLIPLSILLIKYFPEMAREYDHWTGQGYFIGAATSKNMLGVMCLVSGMFFLWDTLTRWRDGQERGARRIIWINIAFFVMSLWLLSMASSATSAICLMLGCALIAGAHLGFFYRRPRLLLTLVPLGLVLYLFLQFGLGIDIVALVAQASGRNPDLTGRTTIWSAVLSVGINPLLGAGYESFWLGPRLDLVWERAVAVNNAHNGYLEVYLNLGLVGVGLLCIFLFASYGTIWKHFKVSPSLGSFSLALWAVLIFYNVTEAAFRGHLLWITFIMTALVVPRADKTASRSRPPVRYAGNSDTYDAKN